MTTVKQVAKLRAIKIDKESQEDFEQQLRCRYGNDLDVEKLTEFEFIEFLSSASNGDDHSSHTSPSLLPEGRLGAIYLVYNQPESEHYEQRKVALVLEDFQFVRLAQQILRSFGLKQD